MNMFGVRLSLAVFGLLAGSAFCAAQTAKTTAASNIISFKATSYPSDPGTLTVNRNGMEFIGTRNGNKFTSGDRNLFDGKHACAFVDARVTATQRQPVSWGLGPGLWIFGGGMTLIVDDKDSDAFFKAKVLAGKNCSDAPLASGTPK